MRLLLNLPVKGCGSINWFNKSKSPVPSPPVDACCSVQTGGKNQHPFSILDAYQPLMPCEHSLFDSIREAIPIVDAAITKIIRLTGDFRVLSDSDDVQKELDRFCSSVRVGACSVGLNQFLFTFLDNLLTYGNAVGEMIPFADGDGIGALYNAPLSQISVCQKDNPLLVDMFAFPDGFSPVKIQHQDRILFSALNPPAGQIVGKSILSGLPFISAILLKIYHSIGQNFDRMGNLRFAVTYNPSGDQVDSSYAQEIAQNLASQWADTMRDSDHVRDFVAVGDVNIRVIGADNQIMDTQIPVRQMLEQIVAKLGLPPFILGLSWSTTERMSKQQAEILTSELESYRNLLTPIIYRVCSTHLLWRGMNPDIRVAWNNLRIADEVEEARARLLQAQADQIYSNIL